MGRLIYQPKGKAAEYGLWACNLYNGCSNRCEYCYNRHCQAKKLLGKDVATLKGCCNNEVDAFGIFKEELHKHKDNIKSDGNELFFSFVSDPCLPETIHLTMLCVEYALRERITCRVLTKRKEIIGYLYYMLSNISSYKWPDYPQYIKEHLIVGMSLTGHDELESGASTNHERIDAIRSLNEWGIRTWVSIEPIIDVKSSTRMIFDAYHVGCREFKIGLLSGKKEYSANDIYTFKVFIDSTFKDCEIKWKRSVLEYIRDVARLNHADNDTLNLDKYNLQNE